MPSAHPGLDPRTDRARFPGPRSTEPDAGTDPGASSGSRRRGLRFKRAARAGPLHLLVVWALAGAGALWGAISYTVLWGYTSIQLTRDFVDSNAGLAALLPVRLVLEAIRFTENRIVHHPFDFSQHHGWIGVVSTAVGAALLALPYVVIAAAARRMGRPH